jgi:uncharacterized protein YcbK (DUF882 family)
MLSCTRLGLSFVVVAAVLVGAPVLGGGLADARPKASARATKPAARSGKRAAKATTRSKKRKGKRGRRSYFSGHGVASSELRVDPLPRPSGDVWLRVENFGEDVRVNIYRPDGSFDEAALAKLDRAFRCKRTGEVRAVDPRLYEALSTIYDRFEHHRVDLVSGFRFQRDEGSRHYHASAMDIRIDGVSGRELYAFAESLDAGGMGIGIYPRSGFVHVDYRAPGDRSYRWTDKSSPDGSARNKQPSARFKPHT